MSFRFNFSQASDSEASNILNKVSLDNLVPKCEGENSAECGYLSLENIDFEESREDISLLQIENVDIKYVLVHSLKMKTENETFSQIDSLKTDIIPGKYEGGLKIWECSIDLAFHLVKYKCIKNGDVVLELGCGAGIPGIIAYLTGASVTFQDFNAEVLKFVTLSNILLNTSKGRYPGVPDVCDYLYGDWESINKKYFSDAASSQKYDIILTSETIYEKSNQKKLLELMKSTLKPNGVIYVAAKTYYFGVGGGIADFEMLIKADGTFEITSVHKIKMGVERQILQMKHKDITQ